MPHITPCATDVAPAAAQDALLPGFDQGWVLLPKAAIGEPGERPVVFEIVLLHARHGVALLEAPPHWTPDAPQRLRRRLERAQFAAIFPGHLPIVHAPLQRGLLPDLPRVLAEAFAAEQPLELPGGDAWMGAVRRALAASAKGLPEAARVPASHRGRRRRKGMAGAALVAGIGGALLLAFAPAAPPGEALGQSAALPGAAIASGLVSADTALPDEARGRSTAFASPDAAPSLVSADIATPPPALLAPPGGLVTPSLLRLTTEAKAPEEGMAPMPGALTHPLPMDARPVLPSDLGRTDARRPATGPTEAAATATQPRQPKSPAAAVPPPVPAFSLAPGLAPGEPALIASLLRRGDALFALGDISGARRFYERAAEAGSAEGARAAGRTHDPAVLAEQAVHGIRPDLDLAEAWYRRADALGAAAPGR
ncbi:hypothetical protein [Roseicella aerolata]|uniref:Uncharacterized protein n=1 Tax=Roseicella aerolata TaxID=2883479 RepID=A0A9X1L6W7_9PROT|nr:hypothetical protein [Roseicella aerolata]MCB4820959.1 hypothetical protein [Roseicella aerolata]